MNRISTTLLKPTSVLVFVVALGLFLHELTFLQRGRRLDVMDKDQQVIGEVYVPHNSDDLKIFEFFVVISGLQMWMVLSATNKKDAPNA